MNESMPQEKRIDQRQYVQCPAQVQVDSHEGNTQSVNFSDGGMRIRFSEPVRFFVHVRIGDYVDEREATMVWARRNTEGKMEIGLQYSPESEMGNKDEKETSALEDASEHPESLYPPNPFWHLRW